MAEAKPKLVLLWQPLPTVLPPFQGTISDLPIIHNPVKATIAGFDDRKHPKPERLRVGQERVAYVKVIFLSKLRFGDDEAALAMGINKDNIEEYAEELQTVKDLYEKTRSRTFGKSSWFSGWVDVVISRHDYEAFCINLRIDISQLKEDKASHADATLESPEKVQKQTDYSNSIKHREEVLDEHIARLHGLYESAFQKARDELREARDKRLGQGRLETLKDTMRHFRRMDSEKWTPDSSFDFDTLDVLPPHRLCFSRKHPAVQQCFWKRNITQEVQVSALWSLRDVVDLRTTFADKTSGFRDYITSALTTAAGDIWRYSLAPHFESMNVERLFAQEGIRVGKGAIKKALPDLRRPHVYANLEGFTKRYFEDGNGPGFAMISVHPTVIFQAVRTKNGRPPTSSSWVVRNDRRPLTVDLRRGGGGEGGIRVGFGLSVHSFGSFYTFRAHFSMNTGTGRH